ncbi:MAG TPA: S9 family peptidase, partial [Brevundimonas sp.]|nr:S9 family peptidase [Brevundimonas sp.]
MRRKSLSRALPAFVMLAVLAGPVLAQEGQTYQQPPAPIADILDSKPTPTPSLSPDRSTIALFERANLPPIAELAEPMLRLAGYRINPRNNGPANSRVNWLTGLSLQPVSGGAARTVPLPAGARFMSPSWSPDGKTVAFLMDAPTGLELWVADVAAGTARRLTDARVNAAAGTGFSWMPDSSGLVVRMTPPGRGPAPDVSRPPAGPTVAESMGRAAPVRTYQDLLGDAGDEALFDHYFTSQLTVVPLSGAPRALGSPAVYLGAGVSPDGRYVLQTTAKRPYSYVVPAALFPADVVVTDLQGRVVHRVADLPLRDNVPTPFDAVAPGPRSVQWRADAPATLVWTEAQDGGDPRTPAEVRDRVFSLAAPFSGQATPLIDLKERYAGITWGDADTALVTSRWFNTRHETRYVLDPSNPGQGRVLMERNYQDRYNDPGFPLTEPNASGFPVMRFASDGRVLVSGDGATREGEYPFLAAMDLNTGQAERIWTSASGDYENIVGLLDEQGRRLVTRRETRNDPPNLFVRDLGAAQPNALTTFPDPAPQLAGVTR